MVDINHTTWQCPYASLLNVQLTLCTEHVNCANDGHGTYTGTDYSRNLGVQSCVKVKDALFIIYYTIMHNSL